MNLVSTRSRFEASKTNVRLKTPDAPKRTGKHQSKKLGTVERHQVDWSRAFHWRSTGVGHVDSRDNARRVERACNH